MYLAAVFQDLFIFYYYLNLEVDMEIKKYEKRFKNMFNVKTLFKQ